MKNNNLFWISFSDLMTSLFFILLVLFVVSFSSLKAKINELTASSVQLEKIRNVQYALQGLDKDYFAYDIINKRYRLKENILFGGNSADILDISLAKREELFKAGKVLYFKVQEIIKKHPDVDYLLVIEGNTQRTSNNWKKIPNIGYELSYKRALSLFNYWKSRDLDFRKLGSQCEIIIAGSGYFGYSRDTEDERNNKKFTIQVTSKVGKLIDSHYE